MGAELGSERLRVRYEIVHGSPCGAPANRFILGLFVWFAVLWEPNLKGLAVSIQVSAAALGAQSREKALISCGRRRVKW